MAKRRFAIITYDPDRIAELNWQAEGNSFSYAILRGISGLTYAKERGIINITVMDQVPVVSSVHKRVK
jgi:hypothetical protein